MFFKNHTTKECGKCQLNRCVMLSFFFFRSFLFLVIRISGEHDKSENQAGQIDRWLLVLVCESSKSRILEIKFIKLNQSTVIYLSTVDVGLNIY